MGGIRQGCSENEHVSTVLEFQFFTQRLCRHGEVTYGDIRLLDTCQGFPQLLLVHRRHHLHTEPPAWEITDIMVGEEEMGMDGCLLHLILVGKDLETSCLHDTGIGLEEERSPIRSLYL